MGLMRPTKVDLDGVIDLIAERLRHDSEPIVRQALPTRWVELIHFLDEQDRHSGETQAEDAKLPPDDAHR